MWIPSYNWKKQCWVLKPGLLWCSLLMCHNGPQLDQNQPDAASIMPILAHVCHMFPEPTCMRWGGVADGMNRVKSQLLWAVNQSSSNHCQQPLMEHCDPAGHIQSPTLKPNSLNSPLMPDQSPCCSWCQFFTHLPVLHCGLPVRKPCLFFWIWY